MLRLICFLSLVLASLMACSAPSTEYTIREKNTVDESSVAIPNQPPAGYQPPAGLPSNIEDLFNKLTYNYWAGPSGIPKEFFYFKKDNSSSNGHAMYHIEIIKQASVGRPAEHMHYYTLKAFSDSSISGGIWAADFYLKDSDGKLNLNTKMGYRMKFLTLTKAEVTFSPKVQSNRTKDYGTFIVTSQ